MRVARASGQLALLSVPPRFKVTGNASARNAYGSAAQEIVCAALDLRAIRINGNCAICPDAEDGAGEFYEIKSCHRGQRVPLYECRMRKEEESGIPLRYAILCHRLKGETDGARIIERMNERGLEILLMRAGTIHREARKEPLHKIKTVRDGETPESPRFGYTRKGYRDGYRNTPISRLRGLCGNASMRRFALYGLNFEIPIFTE